MIVMVGLLTAYTKAAKLLSAEGRQERMAKKEITIALAGNPNSGKTTVFNNITGLRQHVGNWPGE